MIDIIFLAPSNRAIYFSESSTLLKRLVFLNNVQQQSILNFLKELNPRDKIRMHHSEKKAVLQRQPYHFFCAFV